MKYIEIEYNRELKPLEAILSDVKHPGEFFVAGAMEIPMPRVEVKGVGALSFPIPRPQIETLVRHATRAPYGRGEETIIDTSVRDVWQIASASVKIGGKSWPASFDNIVSKVTAGLGCRDATVSAELYKMLVYDRGGFFLAHRDTEKTAGMFGTLVVTLPSLHHGGALRIRHAEREVTVESDVTEPSEISFAAFYADCEHEVMPVREGYRVCLVYNLIHDRTKSRQRILKTPNYESQVAGAAFVLNEFWSSPETPPKIVWLLDHQYTPVELSFSSLKGADAARARVLVQAADRAQCVAYLGVVHIGETGGAEWDGGYDYYDDERDQGEDDDFTAITVDDSWQYLDEWRDRDDRSVDFGRIPLTQGELIPAGALDKEPPDQKRLTEASGNEGATYERSYHRAALALWPANRMIDVLLEGGVAAVVPYLKQLIARGKSARSEAIAVAQRIVEAWPADAQRPDRYSMGITSPESSGRAGMISGLVEMNAPALLEQFIRDAVISTYDGTENASLVASLSVLGVERATGVLSALIEARMPDHPTECVGLLLNLAADPLPSFQQVAEAAVAGLDSIGAPNSEPDALRQLRALTAGLQRQRGLAPDFLVDLFSALRPFKGQLLIAAAEKIGSRPEVFPPTTLVVPAIERICAEWGGVLPAVDRAVQHLWTSAAQFLLLHSEVPPQSPPDWRLPAKLSCTCADCQDLQGFARDPVERVHRFRVKKERRRHLHQVIDRHALDMTHVTERVGSPQTLVCTKDRRTFNARMKEHQSEIAAMRKLVKLTPQTVVAGGLHKRIEAAVEASTI
jgi:hypothetical protein